MNLWKDVQNVGKTVGTDVADTVKGFENAGGQVMKNLRGGQRRLGTGKMKTYGAINPLYGTRTAFLRAFRKPAKIKIVNVPKKRYSRIKTKSK